MLSVRDKSVTILLLVLTQGFIPTSASNETTNAEFFGEVVLRSTENFWIHGMRSVTFSSESPCAEEMATFSAAFHAREMWALEMLDASSKIQSGILHGNIVDLGMYGQCVKAEGKYNGVNVRGRHCMVEFGSGSLELTSSVCLPSSCNETHALQIASAMMKNLLMNDSVGFDISARTATCARTEDKDFSLGEIMTIGFFIAIGSFMILCTTCDFVKRCWPENTSSADAMNTLVKFSAYKNAITLIDIKVKPGTMPSINGIRFLSTCWIVALHQRSALFLVKNSMINAVDYVPWTMSWSAVWYETATFATDNFFMISGFFTSYLFFKKVRSGAKFDLPMMYLHRYIRLTPGVAVVGLFSAFLYHRIGNGPLWELSHPWATQQCKQYWWINFFYIQNFLPLMDICVLQSWFLAADMQMFLISPIILYPLYSCPKYGVRICIGFLLASVIAPTLVVGLNRYTIVGFPSFESFNHYYIRSYTRAFPYLFGLLLGFDMVTKKRRLTKVTVILSWIVSCILMIACCLALHRLKNSGTEYNLVFETLCAALVRPCWSIAMAWIMYACTQGHGGVIARFLSLPIFSPLSRISFGIYLVHFNVIRYIYGTQTFPEIFREYELFTNFLAIMIMSAVVSGVICLFVEMPIMVLENILKTRSRKRDQVTVVQAGNQVPEDQTHSYKETYTKTEA